MKEATSDLVLRDKRVLWHPYTQAATAPDPVAIVGGRGALLKAADGRTFIDGVSAWWTNLHGHGHPYIAKKIYEQAMQLEHLMFAGFTHEPAVRLAERLLAHLPTNQRRVFYSDNGSTAVEVAIKMCVQYWYNQGQKPRHLVAFEEGFHGETFGAMSASGDLSLNTPFHEFMFRVKRIPAPLKGQEAASLAALKKVLDEGGAFAFIFEPLVLGAGGMLMYQPDALDALMAECRQRGVLCIADEVMTGFYRTGTMFACGQLAQMPDLMCLSKGITGGTLPLAVTTSTEAVFDAFCSNEARKTFFHGHSYTANPIGCAAALASLDLLENKDTLDNIDRIVVNHGDFAMRLQGHQGLLDVRQCGTVLAVTYKTPSATSYFNSFRDTMYAFFLDRGAILRPLGNVAYIMPPYCITNEQLEQLYGLVEHLADACARSN
jgi:adenosylmethionine-8-amino-7-oxononanoate aminotransferase